MTPLKNCKMYCLSFHTTKRADMIDRFYKFGIDCKFYSGVSENDKRILPSLTKYNKRHLSIAYSHLDIIYDFYYNSQDKFAIICEDDIIIHERFREIMEKAINDCVLLNLDILLLGYLMPYKMHNENNLELKYPMPKKTSFKYYCVPEYMSGTQMYMISRNYARYLIKIYYNNYTEMLNKYFMIDKILTSYSNCALIYPLIAIENCDQKDPYHKLCHKVHHNQSYI